MGSLSRTRKATAKALGLGLLAAVLGAGFVPLPEATAGAILGSTEVPVPNIGAFIPDTDRVTSVVKMNLDGSATDEEAITAVGVAGSSQYVPTTVVLIAWDNYAKRWTAVFNAAQQSSYHTGTQDGQNGPGLICTCGTGPVATVMHDLPGQQASLVYWVPAVSGNTTMWLIGVVNFKNQLANLVWSDQLDIAHIEAYGVKPRNPFPSPVVVGRSPHQQLLITAPWETPDDNQSYAIRQYSFEVTAVQQGLGEWDYNAVNDSRSFVGVELKTAGGPSGTAKVDYVYPGSPAQGRLHVGDLVEAVAGAKAPPNATSLNGPEVIEQVALFYPGQRIRLVVDRAGQFLDVPMTLGRWSPAIQEYVQVGQNYSDILLSM